MHLAATWSAWHLNEEAALSSGVAANLLERHLAERWHLAEGRHLVRVSTRLRGLHFVERADSTQLRGGTQIRGRWQPTDVGLLAPHNTPEITEAPAASARLILRDRFPNPVLTNDPYHKRAPAPCRSPGVKCGATSTVSAATRPETASSAVTWHPRRHCVRSAVKRQTLRRM